MATKAYIKSESFYDVYERKSGLQDVTHYCPGCGHSIIHRLIAELLDEMKLRESAIAGLPVNYYHAKTRGTQQYHDLAQELAQYVPSKAGDPAAVQPA